MPALHRGVSHLEFVTHLADRLNEPGMLRVRFDDVSERVDEAVDAAWRDEAIVSPDGVENFIATECASRSFQKKPQQLEFLRRQLDLAAAAREAVRGHVEFAVAEAMDLRLLFAAASQKCLRPREQFADSKRLRHVIVRAHFQAVNLLENA